MDGESQAPAEVGMLGRFEAIQKRIETDPEFSRRTLLKGMGAFSLLTALQGMAAIETLGDKEQLSTLAGDICPEYEVSCYLQQAQLDVPAAMMTPAAPPESMTTAVPVTETIPPTSTAPPPPPTTAPPPPPPQPVEAYAASVESLPTPERRNMSYEEFAQHAEQYMSVLPRLEQMHALFPGTAFFHYIPEQLQHIENLKNAVQPSAEKFHAFSFNTAYSHIFNQTESLNPRAFVWHWTGWHYETPDGLRAMSPNSVQLYVHHDAVAYQMVPQLDVVAGHARAMNPFSWGMEMYSGTYDDVHSPLFSFTPAQVETGIYTAVRQLRSRNLPVNQFTLLGHYAADLIFMNPYYDPASGTFHEIPEHKPITIHKFDPPQEFMDMVAAKAMELDQALGPR
jgi:hypothetical protein